MNYSLLATQIQEVRKRVNESTASMWDNAEIVRNLNFGASEFCKLSQVLDDCKSLSTVANQQIYSLPDNYLGMKTLIYNPRISHITLNGADEDDFLGYQYSTGNPTIYIEYKNRKQIWLYPIPSSSASTTALSGALNSTATTVTVDDTSDFPSMGRIIIDSEVIYYTGSTTTTFTGCVRASEETTAASHSNDATVTFRNIEIYHYRKPLKLSIYYVNGGEAPTSTVATTNGSAVVTGTSTTFSDDKIIKAGQFIGFGAIGSTFPKYWYEILTVDSNTQLTLTSNFVEKALSGSSYIITDKTDLSEQYCEAPILYTEHLAYLKDNDNRSTLAWQKFMSLVKEVNSEVNLDYVPVSSNGGGNGMRPSSPAGYPVMPKW